MNDITEQIARALRNHADAITDADDLLRAAADELDRRQHLHNQHDILHALHELTKAFWQSRQQDDQRLAALHHTIHQLSEKISMLQQDIDAAVAQIALNTSAEASATAALGLLTTQVADLAAQLAAIVPGEVVTPETVAALKAATSGLATSLTGLTSAIPSNVPPVVDPPPPVFVPDPALVQAAADALAASDAAAAAAAAAPDDPALAQAATDAKAASDAAAAAAADPAAPSPATLSLRRFK